MNSTLHATRDKIINHAKTQSTFKHPIMPHFGIVSNLQLISILTANIKRKKPLTLTFFKSTFKILDALTDDGQEKVYFYPHAMKRVKGKKWVIGKEKVARWCDIGIGIDVGRFFSSCRIILMYCGFEINVNIYSSIFIQHFLPRQEKWWKLVDEASKIILFFLLYDVRWFSPFFFLSLWQEFQAQMWGFPTDQIHGNLFYHRQVFLNHESFSFSSLI